MQPRAHLAFVMAALGTVVTARAQDAQTFAWGDGHKVFLTCPRGLVAIVADDGERQCRAACGATNQLKETLSAMLGEPTKPSSALQGVADQLESTGKGEIVVGGKVWHIKASGFR